MKIHVIAHCQTTNPVKYEGIDPVDFGRKRKTEFDMEFNNVMPCCYLFENIINEANKRFNSSIKGNNKERLTNKIYFKMYIAAEAKNEKPSES